MANYQDIITAITSAINSNNQGAITGQVLQDTLVAMVSTLGEGYAFAGLATPESMPAETDANVFYVATQKGNYPYYGNISVTSAGLNIIKKDSSFSLVNVAIGGIRQVFLTQAQYDAMVENDQIEEDVMYNIYE